MLLDEEIKEFNPTNYQSFNSIFYANTFCEYVVVLNKKISKSTNTKDYSVRYYSLDNSEEENKETKIYYDLKDLKKELRKIKKNLSVKKEL